MKRLSGLNEPIKIIQLESDKQEIKVPIMKDVFLNIIGNSRNIPGDKTVRVTKMGLAFMVVKDTIDLEDADYDLLVDMVKGTKIYTDFIMGQALMLLEKAKDQEPEKK